VTEQHRITSDLFAKVRQQQREDEDYAERVVSFPSTSENFRTPDCIS
jgi:hypothetical protein